MITTALMAWVLIITTPGGATTIPYSTQDMCYKAAAHYNMQYHTRNEHIRYNARCVQTDINQAQEAK